MTATEGAALNQVYRSKIDLTLAAAVLVLPLLTVLVISLNGLDGVALASAVAMLSLVISFALWLLVTTSYELGPESLVVRSGPFAWRIRLAEISSVERTSDPRAAPALSLDRLRVRYRKQLEILISPADQEGFLVVLHERAPRARIVR